MLQCVRRRVQDWDDRVIGDYLVVVEVSRSLLVPPKSPPPAETVAYPCPRSTPPPAPAASRYTTHQDFGLQGVRVVHPQLLVDRNDSGAFISRKRRSVCRVVLAADEAVEPRGPGRRLAHWTQRPGHSEVVAERRQAEGRDEIDSDPVSGGGVVLRLTHLRVNRGFICNSCIGRCKNSTVTHCVIGGSRDISFVPCNGQRSVRRFGSVLFFHPRLDFRRLALLCIFLLVIVDG
mmetsp:Transcript_11728/g.25369  ORF Transcript_11728/g.25369 Transcript_11728/m.25369 type:complete len:233 (+) Transcript_11728:1342-2040(+)